MTAHAAIRTELDSGPGVRALPLLLELDAAVSTGNLSAVIDARVQQLRARRRVIGREAADHEIATRYAPYGDEAWVGEVSAALLAQGVSVLQAHFLAETEVEHVARLLEAFDIPREATVVDGGCGVGGAAGHMSALRPDLNLKLLNISQAQLDLCPPQFERIRASIEEMPLPDQSVDAVMLNFVLGHCRLDRVVAEAARVTRPGGLLLVYDICAEDAGQLITTFGYNAHGAGRITEQAWRHGFEIDLAISPSHTVLSPVAAALDASIYRETFVHAEPWLFRCRRARSCSAVPPKRAAFPIGEHHE